MAHDMFHTTKITYARRNGLFGRSQNYKPRVIKSSSLLVPDTVSLNEQQKIYWRGRLALHKKQKRKKMLILLLKILFAVILIAVLTYALA